MLLLLGIPLLAIMAGLTAYGFSQLQHGQSHGFLSWLENAAESSLLFVVPLAEQALKLTQWLTRMLGQYFEGTFVRVVHFVAGINTYLQVTARVALTWPIELFRVQERLVWHTIPRLIEAAIKGIGHEAHAAVTILKPLERIVYRVPKISRAAARAAVAAVLPAGVLAELPLLDWIKSHFKELRHALVVASGIAIALPGRIAHDVTVPFGRTIAQIKKRLRRLERVSAGGLAVGAVAFALTRLGLNWIRCNNVKRVGRALCGLSSHVLNDVLALLADAVILVNVCHVITLLEDGLSLVEEPLTAWIDSADAMFVHCNYDLPPKLPAVPLSLPPLTGVTLSLP